MALPCMWVLLGQESEGSVSSEEIGWAMVIGLHYAWQALKVLACVAVVCAAWTLGERHAKKARGR